MSSTPVQAIKAHRGPKPKPISERVLRARDLKPILYPERTYYSRHQKVRTLLFLEHYRVPIQNSPSKRRPTQQEAADLYNIPQRTISDWVRNKKLIGGVGINSLVGAQQPGAVSHCWWPELEESLYKDFIEWREEGRIVRKGWFRVQAGFRFRELYPRVNPAVFGFSDGWFRGFLGRHKITLRSITKKALKVPPSINP